jgi:hypothetical protein
VITYGGFPHLVLDNSVLRDEERIEQAVARAKTSDEYLLVPQVALTELMKGRRGQESLQSGLGNLARHDPRLFTVTKPLGLMMKDEARQHRPVFTIAAHEETFLFRDLLGEIAGGKSRPLDGLFGSITADDLELERVSLEVRGKETMKVFRDAIDQLGVLNPDLLRCLRNGDEQAFDAVLFGPTLVEVVAKVVRKAGMRHEDSEILNVASINGLVILLQATWALDWFAKGGYEATPDHRFTNDGADMEPVLYALLGRDLVIHDGKARRLYEVLRNRLVRPGAA